MTELLYIHLLSSDIRTCFFYRNYIDSLKERFDEVWGIQIRYGRNFELTTYGSISLQSLPEVPDKCLGVSRLLAEKFELKEKDQVLISSLKPQSLKALHISPRRKEDFIILLSCRSFIESNLLNQVRIVSKGQVLPLQIFSNIVVDIEIGEFEPKGEYGQLEKLTEVAILDESNVAFGNMYSVYECTRKNTPSNAEENPNELIANLNKLLTPTFRPKRILFDKNNDLFLPDKAKNKKYIIWPNVILPDNVPNQIVHKYIFITDQIKLYEKNCFGPHCIKILCKIETFLDRKNNDEIDINSGTKKSEDKTVYSYVVSFNDGRNNSSRRNYAFCPSHVMKKLKCFVGSHIKIDKVENSDLIREISMKEFVFDEQKRTLSNHITVIYNKVTNGISNNIKYDYKLNMLVIGGVGTGKTRLIKHIIEWHESHFIFNKLIDCKRLRGKKLDVLYNIFMENLMACCQKEPATLIIDDLHALTQFDEDEEQFNKLYSDRVNNMILSCVKAIQEVYKVFIVATSTGLKQLGALVTTRGPGLFPCIHEIPDLTIGDRFEILNELVKTYNKNLSETLNLKKTAEGTNGYTVQDLSDLVAKATLKCLIAGKSPGLCQTDIDSALSESLPLFLRGITQKKTQTGRKWNDIGGMQSVKKVLTEVFSWPSKHSDIFKSCPLRLQRGVLLYGAPGTGKTILAGALANECGLNFITVKGPEVLSKYVGASEEGVRNLFVQAQKKQPCLLFFDEFESLAPKRGHDSTGVTDRVVNQLLTQLDGVEAINEVWVVAATSRPDLIDPALLRPGRLDKIVFCDLPDQNDRFLILGALSKELLKSDDVDLAVIAKKTKGYTGADLLAILTNAQILAVKKNDKVVSQAHLLESFHDTKPSLSKSEKARYAQIYEKFLNSRKKNWSARNQELGQKVILA